MMEGEQTDIVIGDMSQEDRDNDVVTQIIIQKLEDQSVVQVEGEATDLQVRED